MTKSEYREYLQTEHWQELRARYLFFHGDCEACELPRWLAIIAYDQDLHVHHRNYQRIGAEEDGDLMALCCRCHQIKTFGMSRLRELRRIAVDCRYCDIRFGTYDAWEVRCLKCRLDFYTNLLKSTEENSVVPPLTFPFLPSYDLPVFPIRNPPSETEPEQNSVIPTFPQVNPPLPGYERGSEPGRAAGQYPEAELNGGEVPDAPVNHQPKTDEEIRERRALLKAQAAYLMAKYEQKKAA